MNELHDRIWNSFKAQGLMKTLGARLALVAEGEVHILLPYSPSLTQQRGYIHAGAVTSILDSACGYAALTKAPSDCDVVTAEFKINLMRPAIGERFLAVGKVQNAGKMLRLHGRGPRVHECGQRVQGRRADASHHCQHPSCRMMARRRQPDLGDREK
jgi:uncharacterized protein (TIGR00369 family)